MVLSRIQASSVRQIVLLPLLFSTVLFVVAVARDPGRAEALALSFLYGTTLFAVVMALILVGLSLWLRRAGKRLPQAVEPLPGTLGLQAIAFLGIAVVAPFLFSPPALAAFAGMPVGNLVAGAVSVLAARIPG